MVAHVVGESWIVLTHPAWLAAMLILPLPVLAAMLARRRGRRISALAVAGQCMVLAALAAAMARPKAAIGRWAKLPYLLLTDASGSVRGQGRPVPQAAFPAGATVERFDFADGLARSDTPIGPDATRIAPALNIIASRSRSGLAAAIIATDGRFTDDDWAGAAAKIAELGIDVFIVPMGAPPPDARIVAFTCRRLSGEQVEVTATVSANAPLKRTLTITRSGQDRPLGVRRLSLLADSPAAVRLTDTVAPDAAAEYSASLAGDAAVTENDSAATLVMPLRQVVAAAGFDHAVRPVLRRIKHPVTLIATGSLPTAPVGLARFSCVVVADATGSALTGDQRRALAEYVRRGGGLVLIGTGPHETPADESGPLNRILPLVANPFQRRPLHLAVLLDKSGSMAAPAGRTPGGATQIKFDLAAEAVLALKDHLTPRDTLTVIAFADRPGVVYDSGEAPGDFAALGKALKRVRPAGSTKVTPAIETALRRPAGDGRTTMLLIVSDLKTERFGPDEWAEAFRRASAELAVVAVRESALPETAPATETPLAALAELLDAPYVERDRLAGLAKTFAAMVRRGRGDVVRRKRTAVAVAAALFDTSLTALPDLEAYILTSARKDAETLARTAGGDPVLGVRRAGLGRCVCLAVPLSETENTAWADSPDVAKLIASAVRWGLRSANDPRFDAAVRRSGERLRITVSARSNGEPLNALSLVAKFVSGEHTNTSKFVQVAPGRYEAESDWPADLPAAVAVRACHGVALASRDENGSVVWRGSAGTMYPGEYRLLGTDLEGLRRLASLTGGRIVSAGRLGDMLGQSHRRRLTDLWPWLLGLALVGMLGEWCLVRISRR